jgi:hypothetical protein
VVAKISAARIIHEVAVAGVVVVGKVYATGVICKVAVVPVAEAEAVIGDVIGKRWCARRVTVVAVAVIAVAAVIVVGITR